MKAHAEYFFLCKYLYAVQQICMVVPVMVSVGSSESEQVIIPGLCCLGVTVTSFSF